MTLYEIKTNTQYNSLEIYFTEKPDEATREALKSLKFRWHAAKKCWYGFSTSEKVNEILGNQKAISIPDSEFVDGGGLYDGWRGGNNRKWDDEKQLKSFLMDDFKKAGLKATIRFRNSGYLTAIVCTMTIKPEEIKDFETFRNEYLADFRHLHGGSPWIQYIDDDGRRRDILKDAFCNLPEDEQKATLEKIVATAYQDIKDRLTCSGTSHSDYKEILTESAADRFNVLQQIVTSYNHDCSNSMIDYFDRSIYDDYCFKIA